MIRTRGRRDKETEVEIEVEDQRSADDTEEVERPKWR
jgi:hypothetical protein